MSNAKLKRLINDSVLLSQDKTLKDLENELRNDLSAKKAVLKQVYYGTGKAIIEALDTSELKTAYIIYSVNTPSTSVTYLPEGMKGKNDAGEEYINVTERIIVDYVSIGDSNLILGYSNNGVTAGSNGNLTITSGENTISINKSLINIKSPNLIINGLPYDNPAFIDDVAGDLDDLLDYLVDKL